MLGLRKPKLVAEHEAEGEIERVYHEIKQVLRAQFVPIKDARQFVMFDQPAEVAKHLAAFLQDSSFTRNVSRP